MSFLRTLTEKLIHQAQPASSLRRSLSEDGLPPSTSSDTSFHPHGAPDSSTQCKDPPASVDFAPLGGMRYSVLYCMPHTKVPGVLTISPYSVHFEPDGRHEEVRENEHGSYKAFIDICDILECGAVVMPVTDETSGHNSIAFYLQSYVRTIDGHNMSISNVTDISDAWCIVFWMQTREELHEATQQLLEWTDEAKKLYKAGETNTSIPYACLDCMTEFEATHQNKEASKAPSLLASTERPWEASAPNEDDQPIWSATLRQPQVKKPLLTQSLADHLCEYLPICIRLPGAAEWVLCYTPKVHGISMATFYRNCSLYTQTVLVLMDTKDSIFGGFAPETWEPRGRFYGSGQAFVFAYRSSLGVPELHFYPWSSKNDYFMYSDNESIAMGGGDGRHAIAIDSDLGKGYSASSATFGNPMLAQSEEFPLKDFEVWGFDTSV